MRTNNGPEPSSSLCQLLPDALSLQEHVLYNVHYFVFLFLGVVENKENDGREGGITLSDLGLFIVVSDCAWCTLESLRYES